MKKTVVLAAVAASLLGAGISRAEVDMAIDDEQERRRKAFLDNECSATGQTCSMGPHGPNGEIQCQYCGRQSVMETADFSEVEARSLAHYGESLYKLDGEGRKVFMDPALGLPYDESHALKTQGDVYAEAAKALLPGPDEPLPDRFSVNPESEFYDKRWAQVKIGVRFDGRDRPGDVEEYCISGGWIRIQTFLKNGKVRRERGKIVCIKQHGKVEPYRK